MANHNPPNYRADIDGLRAIAVLVVLGYHAYPQALTGGFIGVDIFFVISGFLISTIIFQALDRDDFSFADFYRRRIRRIFPSLIIVLSACLALGWFLLLTDEYIQLGNHTLAGATFGPNFVFMKGAGYFDSAAELKPLLHLWSLGIEEQFYIVWPLLLVLIWRRVPAVFWVLASLALASFALNIYLANAKPVQNFYLPITRCWELLVGALLAYGTLYQTNRTGDALAKIFNTGPRAIAVPPNLTSCAGALLILLALALIDKESVFPGWWALLPTLGTFLIIAAGPSAWLNRKFLAHPVLVWVGLISYPLYLWHWPLLSFSHIVIDDELSVAQSTLALVVSFVLSWLTYRYWERPFRMSRSAWGVATLVVLVCLLAVAGRVTKKANGFPNRFPDNIKTFANFPYAYSHAKSYRLGVCFIDAKKQGKVHFSEQCLEPTKSKLKKIFLWGDSHAAHLYPGLHHFENQERFSVIQITAGGCPPIFATEIAKRPYCKEINERAWELLKITNPDMVVMAANWSDNPASWNYTDLERLDKTIDALKSLGIHNVVLVGRVPAWLGSGPKALVKYSRLNNWQTPPDRLPWSFAKNTDNLDATIEAIAIKKGISFVSPYRSLCNAEGCLATIDGVPTAFDCCHLTDVASRYLIESNLAKILQLLRVPS